MGPKAFIRELLAWMGEREAQQAPEKPASSAPAATQDPARKQEEHLRKLARVHAGSSAALLAGALKMVGLSEVKEALGERWSGIADRAAQIVEAEIQKHLGPNDLCRRYDDDAFVVCFESANKTAVDAQVERISKAVKKRLLQHMPNHPEFAEISVSVSEVDAQSVADSDDPLAALFAAVMQVRIEGGTETIRRGAGLLRTARVVFQPVWPADGAANTTNLCVLDAASTALANLGQNAAGEMDDWLAQLDYVVFTKAIEILHEALRQAPQTTVIIPIQFQTLSTPATQTEMLRLGAAVPDSDREYVYVEIVGIPRSATAKHLQLVTAVAKGMSPHVILRLSPLDPRLTWSVETSLWGLSVNMEELAKGRKAPVSGLVDWVSAARSRRLRAIAHAANTMALAHAANGAGFHLISGSAVHLAVSAPRPPTRFLAFPGSGSAGAARA